MVEFFIFGVDWVGFVGFIWFWLVKGFVFDCWFWWDELVFFDGWFWGDGLLFFNWIGRGCGCELEVCWFGVVGKEMGCFCCCCWCCWLGVFWLIVIGEVFCGWGWWGFNCVDGVEMELMVCCLDIMGIGFCGLGVEWFWSFCGGWVGEFGVRFCLVLIWVFFCIWVFVMRNLLYMFKIVFRFFLSVGCW